MLEPVYVTGEDASRFSGYWIPVGKGLSGWVAENRRTIVNGNPLVEQGYSDDPNPVTMLCSSLSAPIESANHETLGVITLHALVKNAFSSDDGRVLEALCSGVGRALDRRRQSAGQPV